MEWIADNWFLILIAILFVAMHIFGHGHMHGGHGHNHKTHDGHDGTKDNGNTHQHH